MNNEKEIKDCLGNLTSLWSKLMDRKKKKEVDFRIIDIMERAINELLRVIFKEK